MGVTKHVTVEQVDIALVGDDYNALLKKHSISSSVEWDEARRTHPHDFVRYHVVQVKNDTEPMVGVHLTQGQVDRLIFDDYQVTVRPPKP